MSVFTKINRYQYSLSTVLKRTLSPKYQKNGPYFSQHFRPGLSLALVSSSPKFQIRTYKEHKIYGHRIPFVKEVEMFSPQELENRQKNARLVQLVDAFREFGHYASNLDPLNAQPRTPAYSVDPNLYGFSDPNEVFDLKGILHINESETSTVPKKSATFAEILDYLNSTYSGNLGYEFMQVPDIQTRKWFSSYIEKDANNFKLTNKQKEEFFELLTLSEFLETFLQKKYSTFKRYGGEGTDTLMVAYKHLINLSASKKIDDIILGMSHRGRMTMLFALLGLPLEKLFYKLLGNSEYPTVPEATGDFISLLGGESVFKFEDGHELKFTSLPSPSHLDHVNPVAMGKARGKQTDKMAALNDSKCNVGDKVLSVQAHGDASFSGQGIVMESLGLANLPHYGVGGSIHIVVNNQIGYTTPTSNGRSTRYSSDIAKMIDAPIIHVNADHPEDVARAVEVAFAYRDHFRKDVVIDLIGFRRRGHNEMDEPDFTQPLMYKIIRNRKSAPKLYEESLIKSGVITQEKADQFRKYITDKAELARSNAKSYNPEIDAFQGKWSHISRAKGNDPIPETGVDKNLLVKVGKASVNLSPEVITHPRLEKYHIQSRLKRLEAGTGIDWSTAEALAFGSLLAEGYSVRLSGEDVGRGTFSQRHAMIVCQNTERVEVPLNNLPVENAAKIEVANSHLSELAVLAFEIGVSWESPDKLVVWEAQFGDFNTGAQSIIDNYLVSGETKWMRQSGLVLILPHGYDGIGSEHSSSRIERFLQMASDPVNITSPDTVFNPNICVIFPTTPAQMFHALRRQLKTNFRRPLIVAGPKTLLKLSTATSPLDEMGPGTSFKPILDDPAVSGSPDSVTRVVFVSGKFYYELAAQRSKDPNGSKIAFVRIEELCPFPRSGIVEIINKYKNATDFVYCQEESENAGGYLYLQPRIDQLLELSGKPKLRYVGRFSRGAVVTSIPKVYESEQNSVIQSAWSGL
ncbi:hypothetical protein BB560_001919 [Smittium megazygosporum]|uniref:Transketolase-like pyrimidine-binding domain-containing protein n=1 Tax=Smittium megazygosporum TaxID=133381 RepID=A0A2T9ZG96_9FUNG|nr:hypothetical protein BB560_001919 [Smittium megazygosporum]